MRRLTASKMALASRCLYPWGPGVAWDESAPGEAAERGQRIHAAIAASIGQPSVHMLTKDDHDEGACVAEALAWLATQPGHGIAVAEAAFAVADGKARLLGHDIGREYDRHGATDADIVGSADALWFDGDCVVVCDWKSGRPDHVEEACTNAQMRFLAFAAARHYKVSEAQVWIVFLSAEGVQAEGARFDALELDCIGEELRDLAAKVGAEAAPAPGEHCRYCPARVACPAVVAAATELAAPKPWRLDLDTPAGIVEARALTKAVRDACDKVDDMVKDRVRGAGGTLALGNGKALWLVQQTRETLQWDDAQKAAMREAGRVKVSSFEVLKEVKA